ncbi:MarR family winged helix-turn-helix transcriptional regulator [Rhodoplanes azumiensis]|uniref:MarR family winged helix-turn-helix transcriptional regulator n=1 Tax=Rhodoplanes azumiensis TaxID=1897628 RepID=A0ABW5AHY7_9BRAD
MTYKDRKARSEVVGASASLRSAAREHARAPKADGFAATSAPTVPAASPSRPYDFREQIGHLLRRAYQRHVAIFQQNAADPQLTAVQFVTLCTLRERGPSSQSELVRATAVDQGTIRGVIERLTARRLVAIATDGGDRRKVIVHLTSRGSAMIDRMVPSAHRITELTMGELDPVERVALVHLLRKMTSDTVEP